VIVTCHEPHLKWLPQALASIQKQSLLPVERLVVFDRCKCPEYLGDDWRFIEGDWGHPAGARNAGIASTNAPWIIFWDADNVMPDGYVLAAQKALSAASHNIAILYPDIQYCDENLKQENLWKTPEWNYWGLRAANYIDTASVWRRETLEIIGGWSDRAGLIEDYSLALDITAAGWKSTKLPGPPVLMRVHSGGRLRRRSTEGGIATDIWKARSLAIVSLLAGREAVFQSWANFLLNAELPPKTSLYVIENSGNPDFNRLAIDTCQEITRMRGLSHLRFATINQRYHSTNSEPYFTKNRHLHVARLYASIFPHITEDLILTLEDDVEPPLDAVRKLGEQFGWASPREKVGAIAAAYSMPEYEDHVCAGRGLEEWGEAVRWQDLTQEPMDIGCVGGGCTIWANWALNGYPVNFWWQRGLGWDGALSIQLRHRGYQVKLHGGVRCEHHLHGRVNGNSAFWMPMQLGRGSNESNTQQINQHADSWIHPGKIGTYFPPYQPTFGFEPFINERHRSLSECSVRQDATIDIGIAGWLRKEDALKLYEMAYFVPENLLEIGCYQGLSTSILAQAVKDSRDPKSIVSLDIEASHLASAERQLISRGLKPHVNFKCSDAVTGCQALIRQHRRFGLIFVDHSHQYQDIVEICQLIPDLLLSGGFCIFHDFNDQRNKDPNNPDYGVSQAVYDRLNIERFEFYGIFGCVAMYRKR
jgi:predicted O-methyltransferase YrrM